MSHPKHGLPAIAEAFQQAQTSHMAALMPYYTLGYPDRATATAVVKAIAPYSHLLELGVPFSDPLADGPTIQQSTQIALENGMTNVQCLEIVRELRASSIHTPVLLMGYMNPILAYGMASYVRDAAHAGVDGFIVPDLPPEESEELEILAQAAGLACVQFLAPTSNPKRIAMVTARAKGFLYLVSLTGVTGARAGLADGLSDFVTRVRQQANVPLAVGFGIGTPQQARTVGELADGVIVGSALINTVAQATDKPAAAAAFVQTLNEALKK